MLTTLPDRRHRNLPFGNNNSAGPDKEKMGILLPRPAYNVDNHSQNSTQVKPVSHSFEVKNIK